MRIAFNVYNAAGRWLCLQYASSAGEAVKFARMYGVRGAFQAREVD